MKLVRPLIVLALLFLGTQLSASYSEHHEGETVFQTLFMHLSPAKLVKHAEAGAEAPTEHGAAEGAGAHGEVHGEGHGAAEPLLAATVPGAPAFFDMDPAHEGTQLVATNLQLFQALAVLLILVCFSGVPRYVRTGEGDYLSKLFAGFAMWVRDEMVYPVMGRETGRRFLPYFLTLFFFILFMNVLGLVPGSATATANIFVTGALAVITLASMVISGMVTVGPVKFFTSQVPHVPAPLWPLMFLVEVSGLLLVKPFALMVRLFANMTGGHMVVLSFMALIFYFAGTGGPAVGWASSPLAVGFAVFIMIIESFVALLQAYIFTQLSIIFVQMCVHPEH